MAATDPGDKLVVNDPTALDRVRSSMVSLRIGGRSYPAVRSPRCKVCTHPARVLIEERLLYNDPYPAVVQWVSEHEYEEIDGQVIVWPSLTVAQLGAHFRSGHCPIDTQVLHSLTEQRAEELGADYEQSVSRIVDHVTMLKQIAVRGSERLVRGEIEPGIKETISAAKALAAIEIAGRQEEQQDNASLYEQAMEVYFTTARQIMNPEQWQQFGLALSKHPVLRRLAEQQDTNSVMDAEIVSEA